MKKLAFATAVVFLLTVTSQAQDSCQRHVETGGGFSICIPVGWEVREKEGEKFKLLVGTSGQNFTPNINFKDDQNDSRSLDEYTTASMDYLLKHYKEAGADSVKLVNQEPFTTASGVSAVKVTLRAESKGLLVRLLQYYFNGKGEQKLIMTATALEGDQATFDPIFDRAAKSFRLENDDRGPTRAASGISVSLINNLQVAQLPS